jgi:Protein of unknown function (DUF3102)
MTEIANSTFDYGCLAPVDAATLRQQALRLRGLVTKTTADMIEIGRDLMLIKDRLDHGQFTSWVEVEIGISIRTAQGYMRFAMLAEGKSETVALLPPSTARMLASKSAPPEIVEQVITQAAAGNIVPDRVVKDLISEKHAERRQPFALRLQATSGGVLVAGLGALQVDRSVRTPESVAVRPATVQDGRRDRLSRVAPPTRPPEG